MRLIVAIIGFGTVALACASKQTRSTGSSLHDLRTDASAFQPGRLRRADHERYSRNHPHPSRCRGHRSRTGEKGTRVLHLSRALLLAVGLLRFVPGVDDLLVRILNVNEAVAFFNIAVGAVR
ncbi:MAG: hypothetical protein M3466_02560 [Gemmatimonadota bacterium]|nr:hypothetical protein [Gemmatimonadota bacterium]